MLAALLGLHLIAQHFVASGGLRDFHDVLSYVANPLVVVLELAFLLLVVVHGLLGVRSIALDLGPSPRARTWLGRATVAIGLGTLSYGIWLGLAIQRLAT